MPPDPTPAFTLQILHLSDEQARVQDLGAMAQSAAIIDRAEDDYANTITIAESDLWLPGRLRPVDDDPAVVAAERGISGDPGQAGAPGRTAVAYLNAIGADVVTINGLNPGDAAIAGAIGATAGNAGARFPVLADIGETEADPTLRALVTADGQDAAANPGRVAGSTVVTVGGQRIGVVSVPNAPDEAILVAVTQSKIDALLAQGVNKVILHSSTDKYLAGLLSGVDVIVSRSGNPFRDGSLMSDKDRKPVLLLRSQDGYGGVGRAVVEFDADGALVSNIATLVSGQIAATDAGVASLWGGADPYAPGSKGAVVQALSQAAIGASNSLDGNVLGFTRTFLGGAAQEERSGETNLGRLVTDANLRTAQAVDPAVVVALTDSSAFRGFIGALGSTRFGLQPPAADPSVGKPANAVSQLDLEVALNTNRGLSLVSVTAARLLDLLEHGVAAYGAGASSRQFPQVRGLRLSFDPSRQAQVLDSSGAVTMPGERVRDVALANADGSVREVLVRDGRILGNPDRTIRMVVPDALADGGDGYRFDLFGTDRVNLLGNPTLPDGGVDFAAKGTEHDALGEFLKAVAPTPETALAYYNTTYVRDFSIEVGPRIQDLSKGTDAVLRTFPTFPADPDLLSQNYGARSRFLFSTFYGRGLIGDAPPIVLSAPDLAGLGAPVAGERTFAHVTAPAPHSSIALPTGFEGLIAGGRNAATLSASAPGAILIDNAGRSALTTTGGSSSLVAALAGTSMLAQGAGNTVMGGAGDDSMAGGGAFFTGGGSNLVSLNETGSVVRSEGRDTIFTGLAGPASDTIGAATGSAGAVVFAGAGRLTFINAYAPSTVTGGAGGSATIFGGTGGGIFQGGSAGGNRLIGEAAAPPPPSGTIIWSGPYDPGARPIGGGSGTVTLIGGGDGDLLYANGAGQNVLVAGPGNSTLIGGADAGGSVFVGAFGSAATTVTGGARDDIIFAGTGSLVADGGRGVDLFVFTADRPGGTTVINGFDTAQDRLALLGHDPGEAGRALAAAQVSDGSTTLTLADNTRITFTGITTLGSSAFL